MTSKYFPLLGVLILLVLFRAGGRAVSVVLSATDPFWRVRTPCRRRLDNPEEEEEAVFSDVSVNRSDDDAAVVVVVGDDVAMVAEVV